MHYITFIYGPIMKNVLNSGCYSTSVKYYYLVSHDELFVSKPFDLFLSSLMTNVKITT